MSKNGKKKSGAGKWFSLIVVIGVLAVAYFIYNVESMTESQTSVGDVAQKLKDVATTTGDFFSERKAKYGSTVEKQISNYETELTALKQQAEQLTGSARETMDEKVNAMEIDLKSLKQKASEIGDASSETWDDMKTGMDSALDKLNKSIEDTKTKIVNK